MNRKGSAFFIALIAIIYFIAGMILYQFLKPDIAIARSDLSCTTPDTTGDIMSCLVVGSIVPIAVITVLSGAGGYLTDKYIR